MNTNNIDKTNVIMTNNNFHKEVLLIVHVSLVMQKIDNEKFPVLLQMRQEKSGLKIHNTYSTKTF